VPIQAKSLFRADVLRPKLNAFTPPADFDKHRALLKRWRDLIASAKIDKFNETAILPDFISELFQDILGYQSIADNPDRYTIRRENLVIVDGKRADAAIGIFNGVPTFLAVLEGKGPLDPLDRPFGSRKKSAVDQGFDYAINLKCNWILVTNLKEIRLYYKGEDKGHFEQFETIRLADDEEWLKKFIFLLGADRVVRHDGSCHLPELLNDSEKIGAQVTTEYYKQFAGIRLHAFEQLCDANPEQPKAAVLTAAQKLLDRILFCTFAENRGLLPHQTVNRSYQYADPYNPRPIWDNFRGLFRSIDKGNPKLEIDEYNGGLFATDTLLDGTLKVSDTVCKLFTKLAEYDYRDGGDGTQGRPVDVDILGHIFEQSITDLERIHDKLQGRTRDDDPTKGRRKKEGAFYTPAFITRYIVSQTLKPVLADRFAVLKAKYRAEAPKGARKLFEEDLENQTAASLSKVQTDTLAAFWQEWQDVLATIRILDPACGSGAFLIEAFNQLHREYDNTNGRLRDLGKASLFDPDESILKQNLYGVDLNEEAIEICRLSLWIKTAKHGHKLTSLDHTVRVGNSIVNDPAVDPRAFDWEGVFPEVTAAGGFDVVVANPPYVRQEWIAPIKPHLQTRYRAFDSVADLYVYFYELALNRLKPGGRMGFVVTNKWIKAGYAEALRRMFAEAAWVESIIDFGHAKQIFPDADVFPCILIARKPDADASPTEARVCTIPREQLRVDDLTEQINEEGFRVPRQRLTAAPWSLEPPAADALMAKIRRVGIPLKKFAGVKPLSGIKTGCNEAFLIDTPTRYALVKADPTSDKLIKPYVRGQDIKRWHTNASGLWMIAMKSSGDHPWPWANAGAEAEKVFASTYPALHEHFQQYRDALHKRQDKGQFWWELRSCAYWDQFDQPKIPYQDITWQLQFCLDTAGMLCNNTVYFLPSNDRWVLSVLNAPISWWFSWRSAQHGKDEALRFFTDFMESFPIPEPEAKTRESSAELVGKLNLVQKNHLDWLGALFDWLRAEYDIDKPTQKLANVLDLDTNDMIDEVKKIRGKKNPLSIAGLKHLRDEYVKTIDPARALRFEALQLERQLGNLVNEAYGLTPDELALMWKTAPPRMPYVGI
jgi:type I restriction-modification system DNA methylase subunit